MMYFRTYGKVHIRLFLNVRLTKRASRPASFPSRPTARRFAVTFSNEPSRGRGARCGELNAKERRKRCGLLLPRRPQPRGEVACTVHSKSSASVRWRVELSWSYVARQVSKRTEPSAANRHGHTRIVFRYCIGTPWDIPPLAIGYRYRFGPSVYPSEVQSIALNPASLEEDVRDIDIGFPGTSRAAF